jgi:hypothetical protein
LELEKRDIEDIVRVHMETAFPILSPEKEVVTRVEIKKEIELVEKQKEKVIFKEEKGDFQKALDYYKGIDC